ncbi:MAG: trehalose-6-phosphate synthase [Actinomycetia bacterium]|nr:trehalose-6-phosphate synthase [Actinomycetes bacterium]
MTGPGLFDPSARFERSLVILSNRGPVAFAFDDAGLPVARKTGGGLASGVRPALARSGGLWICAPLSDADRSVAASLERPINSDGTEVVFADVPEGLLDAAVGRVANEYLWFIHHGMSDLALTPSSDDWDAFARYNKTMAEAVARSAPEGAVVAVQDYHLPLVAASLAETRSDLATVHFSHIPFASPEAWREVDTSRRRSIAAGLAAHGGCGFHAKRWAERFLSCCELDGIDPPDTYVTQLAPDIETMRQHSRTADAEIERARLRQTHDGRRLIIRVDRLEPTKNHLAGFDAFADLLERRPDMIDRVVMVAYAYPSRSGLDVYRKLRDDTVDKVETINRRFGTDAWQPIDLDLEDNLDAAAAGLTRYDVLLINPVEDGLNLVAFEGAALNTTTGAIVLSRNCGAHDVLEGCVESIDPTDVAATSVAIERALELPPRERSTRATEARLRAEALSPEEWLDSMLRATVSN